MPLADNHPLAEVKVSKLKDCPMLMPGQLDIKKFQEWSNACHWYLKHSEKKPEEIVRFVADGMLEPRFVKWYHANQTRINALSLDKYLTEFAKYVLPRKWEHSVRNTLLSSKQGNKPFADWQIELENLNTLLANTKSMCCLSDASVQAQLEANMNPDLHAKLDNTNLIATTFPDWIREVTELDEDLCKENACTQCLIDANNAAHAAEQQKHKPLAECLSDPPTCTQSPSLMGSSANANILQLPQLTEDEKRILKEHEGCTQCRVFYCGHAKDLNKCPMKINSTWPDPKNYKTLTLKMALAAKNKTVTGYAYAEEIRDDDTDSDLYVPPSDPPLTGQHMKAMVELSSPSIPSFPIFVKALLDNGCPSTVISDVLVTRLGLCHFPLPKEEDNLTSLSESPLHCKEYVKLELLAGKGAWSSGVSRAKMNVSLPVPLLLGIPFLSSKQIVLDVHARTAIDKRTGFNIMAPPPPRSEPIQNTKPPKKKRKSHEGKASNPSSENTTEQGSTPELEGREAPDPKTILAMVLERIKGLAFQEKLQKKDAELKEQYADRFPARLPDIQAVPNNIHHRIWLKDPHKVVNARGYAAPKKYHEAWKKLLDEHLAASRLQSSSSEFASPSFCIPKYRNGVPDPTIPPRWVNDY
ncbi:hypothetical protein H2248_001727 [Termitomyces sp. 'cryptogamus']|nr:hypothetical protein H2248_001727 [Termitomyces sp. 'cryptogamus']